jgi:SAM-dependent methyltransferase
MSCQGCGHIVLETLLEFAPQPVTNRFLVTQDAAEERFPLTLGQCPQCGLLQLLDPVPSAALLPRFDWLIYREPEEHVPAMAKWLCDQLPLSPASRVCAFSSKDDSTVAALHARGVGIPWYLAREPALTQGQSHAAVETLTDLLTPTLAASLAEERGGVDLVIIRQLMEHAADLPKLLASLRSLLRPGGAIMVEVPDCSRWMAAPDYTGIWEEHRLYFTPATALTTFAHAGWQCRDWQCFPYPYEDSLVFLLVPEVDVRPSAQPELTMEFTRARIFAEAFAGMAVRYREALEVLVRRHHGGVALFGAGHSACAFVNYYGLADLIDLVIDDNPHKAGLFLPGARLPITGSAGLAESDIRICLTCFAPEYEDRVMAQHRRFLEAGGCFYSIFSGSARGLLGAKQLSPLAHV